MRHHSSKSRPTCPPAGYTLIEMVVASVSATVLMSGLASSLYIASQSLDVATGPLSETRTANAVLDIITRDVQSALTLSELTPTAVTMTVPDRDGNSVPETVRYAWSGSAGDPLTQDYNGTVTNLATNVQSFSLNWLTRFMEGVTSQPQVLLVGVGQAADGDGGLGAPTTAEQDRIDLMESWGYDVTFILQSATQTEIDDELANANVVYVVGNAIGIGTKLNAATIGVATESFVHAQQMSMLDSGSLSTLATSQLDIQNTSHYITTGYSPGDLEVTTTNQTRSWTVASFAPEAASLANVVSYLAYPSLVILDSGDELVDASAASGRRCLLPWGENGFNVTTLNTDGQTIMQRALEWAAGAGSDTESPGIVFQEFTEAHETTNTTNITITTPPGTADGDLLIAALATDGNETGGSGMNAPAGWTPIVVADANGAATLGVWWKIAASEGTDHQFTWPSSEKAYGWIMRFTGHDPTNPPITATTTATAEGTNISPTAPTVTTTVDGCLILRVGGFDDDDVTVDDPGMTDHITITCDESNDTSGAAAYQMQGSAGSTGTADFSLTGSEQFRTVTIAIAPDPSP